MAYYYNNSSYYQNDDQSYNTGYYEYHPTYAYDSHDQIRYVQNYDQTQFYYGDSYHETQTYHGNSYQQAPTQSIIGYFSHQSANDQHELIPGYKDASFDDHDRVTTEFIVSLSTTELEGDLDYEEYNPEPFHGGYDMAEAYGKPLPPSDDICYPRSKIGPVSPSSDPPYGSAVPSPYGKGDRGVEKKGKPENESIVGGNVGEEEPPSDIDEDDEEDEEGESEEEDDDDDEGEEFEEEEGEERDEGEGNRGNLGGGEEENRGKLGGGEEENRGNWGEEEEEEDRGNFEGEREEEEQVRRQIPPGYGLEALDLCEGVFGGYFPCLRKIKQGRCDQMSNHNGNGTNCSCNCNHSHSKYGYDYNDCWRGAADYLFGNPNPYGGSMPERGSYGDPVYSYQRCYPQQTLSVEVEDCGDYSLLNKSRYYYGDNNGDYL